jgi:hypothetical protein
LADGSALLWFHAFDRGSPDAVVGVLNEGPVPNPNPKSSTQRNEAILGIDGPCVYAYLGRTSTAFGQRAVALMQEALIGMVSPFDTGGLVSHIKPVRDWEDDEKREFLRGHSWATDELPVLLALYPGDLTADYLDGRCPAEEGPHLRLPVKGRTAGRGLQACRRPTCSTGGSRCLR